MALRHSSALDQRLADETAWLNLTAMRLLTHPALPQVFVDYLVALYHSMRTAGALMDAARRRSAALAGECPVAARLVDYWTQHIREEAGHDQWLLEDMREAFGVRPERHLESPPDPIVAELIGTLHFWVLHTHPIAALSYFYVIERSPPTDELVDWLVHSAGLPREGLRTFSRHAIIDRVHGRDLEELLDTLPLSAAHLDLLALSASTVLRQLARLMEALIERADVLHARRAIA